MRHQGGDPGQRLPINAVINPASVIGLSVEDPRKGPCKRRSCHMYTSISGSRGLRAAPEGTRFSGWSSWSQGVLGGKAVGETPMGAAGRVSGQRAGPPMWATAFCPVSGNFSYKPLSLTFQRNTVILSLLDLNLTPTLCFNIPDGGDLENPPAGTLFPLGRAEVGGTALRTSPDFWETSQLPILEKRKNKDMDVIYKKSYRKISHCLR